MSNRYRRKSSSKCLAKSSKPVEGAAVQFKYFQNRHNSKIITLKRKKIKLKNYIKKKEGKKRKTFFMAQKTTTTKKQKHDIDAFIQATNERLWYTRTRKTMQA